MLEFIFAAQNQPFAVAIALMLLIALLEGVTTHEEVLRVTWENL